MRGARRLVVALMRGRSALAVVTVSALVLLGVGGLLSAQAAHPRRQRRSHLDRRSPSHPVAHVLMISVDGLHESDLEWYMRAHPGSALAKLARGGTRYANARASVPSDAYAGTVAALTGGDPGVSGIYSGLGYDHDVLVPGSTSCAAGTPRGARVDFGSSIDRDPASIDAGQGLAGLPRTILQMTGSPHRLIDPARLPVDPRTCRPLYPHQDLRVNTVFEVARDHEMRTAWSDQHPSYEILDGPSGRGVQDLFTPEISSQAIGYPAGQDWTDDAAATMRYDSFKLHAVLREVAGYDHGGVRRVGVPALFGLSLQAVSVAQQRQSSDGLSGGYRPGTEVPGPLLRRALDYLDTSIATIVHELSIRRLTASTAIVLSAAPRSIPAGSQRSDPDRRRPDHRRDQRRLDGLAPAHRPARRRGHRQRRARAVAVGPLRGRGDLRRELPADPRGDRDHDQRRRPHAGRQRPGQGLRRPGQRRLLRHPARRSAPSGRVGARPPRGGVQHRHERDRGPRRCRSAGSRRAPGGVRARSDRRGRHPPAGAEHPDRAHDPAAARSRPARAAGGPGRGHAGPAGDGVDAGGVSRATPPRSLDWQGGRARVFASYSAVSVARLSSCRLLQSP
ncbi:MAG: alkaline phosphatase family protein [Solirubrobacteraceae bacterium]